MTAVIFELLKLNSRVLNAGDKLVADLGLTSARWQILGSIIATDRPQPVAWLARDLGAYRQNVQRIINDLARDGLVIFQPNPHHRRAQLVVLTEKGKQTYEAAMELQAPWVNGLADGLAPEEIDMTRKVMSVLRERLESNAEADDQT